MLCFYEFSFDNVTKSSPHMHIVCMFQNMTLCFDTYVWYAQRM